MFFNYIKFADPLISRLWNCGRVGRVDPLFSFLSLSWLFQAWLSSQVGPAAIWLQQGEKGSNGLASRSLAGLAGHGD